MLVDIHYWDVLKKIAVSAWQSVVGFITLILTVIGWERLLVIVMVAIIIYVLGVTIWSQRQLRAIRNTSGGLLSGTEQALKVHEQRIKEHLLGFTPKEALSIVIAVASLISGLIYSSS